MKLVSKTLKLALASAVALSSFAAHAGPLTDSIPHPYRAVHSNGENQVALLDDSMTAFAARIDMIRRAKRNIEVEYFIYHTDTSSKIFTKELIAAAKRGVKVRVLIDKSFTVFEFNEFYAKELAPYGIQVRYYNAAPLYKLSSLQFRTHRKQISVDDNEAITGGRNIADDYFDMSTHFNFNDSDIYVKGPMVKVMRQAFDRFFEHKITERPVMPTPPSKLNFMSKYEEKTALAKAFLKTTKEEVAARQRLDREGFTQLANLTPVVCPQLTFTTDAPGANFVERLKGDFIDKYRFLRKVLFEKITATNKRLIVSSPYVIDGVNNNSTLDHVLKNGAEIDVYTNSLGSTDATYVAANMYLGLKGWRNAGVNVYLHDGKWIPTNPLTPLAIRKARNGTHSKVQVYISNDHSEVMVGTYNVDHRSNYYNAEMALFCSGSEEFTDTVVRSIERNIKHGLTVSADAEHTTDRHGKVQDIHGATPEEIRKMKLITIPSRLAQDLL